MHLASSGTPVASQDLKAPFHSFGSVSPQVPTAHPPHHCAVCMQFVRKENLLSLACQHQFCRSCWEQHCSVLVKDGVGVGESAAEFVRGWHEVFIFSFALAGTQVSFMFLLSLIGVFIVRTISFQTHQAEQWQDFP